MSQNLNHNQAQAASTETGPPIVNVTAYKFVGIDDLSRLRQELLELCFDEHIRGTILISAEGINFSVAGTRAGVGALKDFFAADVRFNDLIYKESLSHAKPYARMLVKIKKEIIPLGRDDIEPEKFTGPHISPQELKQWLDEGREFTLLDTRNNYEIDYGTFEKATILKLRHFRDFPQAVEEQLDPSVKKKPMVMFCTGGVRCEKASPALLKQGFEKVYQLDGGILNYFIECGGAHYQGDCFVFDERIAIDPALQETGAQ